MLVLSQRTSYAHAVIPSNILCETSICSHIHETADIGMVCNSLCYHELTLAVLDTSVASTLTEIKGTVPYSTYHSRKKKIL